MPKNSVVKLNMRMSDKTIAMNKTSVLIISVDSTIYCTENRESDRSCMEWLKTEKIVRIFDKG